MSDADQALPPESLSAVATVPECVPMPAPAAEAHRRIGFLTALFVYWLRPKQLGPHLTADPFRRAFTAHLIALAAIAVIVGMAVVWETEAHDYSMVNQTLRVRAAHCVLQLAEHSADILEHLGNRTWDWGEIVPGLLGGVFVVELVLLAMGTLLMPLAAAGDRASSVWNRSIKNVYWCTTLGVPIALACVLLDQAGIWDFFNPMFGFIPCVPRGPWGPHLLIVGAILMIASLALLARALNVGARRCVGQVVGPIMSHRPAQCDDCGYPLRGLPLDTKCPECGRPVQESLDDKKRSATGWQREGLRLLGSGKLLRMQWAALCATTKFRNIPVYRGVPAAQRFWWLTWFLMAAFLWASLNGVITFSPANSAPRAAGGLISLMLAVMPWALQTLMMFVACYWGRVRYNIRDYRVSSIVCYYASPAMWPLLIVVAMMTMLSDGMLGASVRTGLAFAKPAGGLLAIGGLVLWWLRIRQGLNRVQYANE